MISGNKNQVYQLKWIFHKILHQQILISICSYFIQTLDRDNTQEVYHPNKLHHLIEKLNGVYIILMLFIHSLKVVKQ